MITPGSNQWQELFPFSWGEAIKGGYRALEVIKGMKIPLILLWETSQYILSKHIFHSLFLILPRSWIPSWRIVKNMKWYKKRHRDQRLDSSVEILCYFLFKSKGNVRELTYFNQSSSNINQQIALFQWLIFGDGEICWEKHFISFFWLWAVSSHWKTHVFSGMHMPRWATERPACLWTFPIKEKYRSKPNDPSPLCWQPVLSEQPCDTWTLWNILKIHILKKWTCSSTTLILSPLPLSFQIFASVHIYVCVCMCLLY